MNIPFGNLRAMLWGKCHFSGDLKNEIKISIPGRVFQAGETLGIKGKEVWNALNSWKKKNDWWLVHPKRRIPGRLKKEIWPEGWYRDKWQDFELQTKTCHVFSIVILKALPLGSRNWIVCEIISVSKITWRITGIHKGCHT